MLNLLIRLLLFVIFLVAGFAFGWEFLLGAVIFLIAIGKIYWEHMLLAFIFDILFGFPLGFFTVVFSSILIAALLADDFFKSDSMFNRFIRGLFASLAAVFLFILFFAYLIWPNFGSAIREGAIIFIEISVVFAVLLLLLKLVEPKLDEKKLFR